MGNFVNLLNTPERIRRAPDLINQRRDELKSRLKTRYRHIRGEGEERIFVLRTRALERMDCWLKNAQDMPVVSAVAPRAGDLVRERLEHATRPPLADMDSLNAKDTIREIRGLCRKDLYRLRHYEQTHKDRKTVLSAIDTELQRRAEQ